MADETMEIVEAEYVELGALRVAGPAGVIQRASGIATELKAIIDRQKLYSRIQGRNFVRVEGWSTMGAMLGVLPREVSAQRLEDGSYEAVVELIRVSDGAIIGRASAICGMDEKDSKGRLTWGSRPEYARRSMAVTRATSKAYRLGFSWIMTLAGYEPTPAEEMTGVLGGPKSTGEKPPEKKKAASKPKAKKSNGRPLQPDKLKEFLQRKIEASGLQDQEASDGQRGLVASKLEECFAPQIDADAKRHSVLYWLMGSVSTKALSMAEASALIDWLLDKDADPGTYDLHKDAPEEARRVLNLTLKEQGQQELAL